MAKADRRKSPAIPTAKALIAVAIPAWCVGFFFAGGLGRETASAHRKTNADSGAAETSEAGVNPDLRAEQRRERVLSALFDAMQMTDETRRIRLVSIAVEKLGPGDIQAALEMALSRGDLEHEAILPKIVARWAELEPGAAAEYALKVKGGEGWSREDLIACVATLWAGGNPAAAKAWALALPPGKDQQAAITGVVSGMERNDPAAALGWVKALPEAVRPKDMAGAIFMKWAERDPSSASQYALAMPMGQERQRSLAQATYKWAEKDPQAAMEVLRQLPDSYEKYHLAADKLFMEWAEKDPGAAMAAALTLSEVSKRDRAIEMILSKVGLKGEAAVARILEKLPEGTNRNAVLGVGLAFLAYENPQVAAALALSLPSGEVRDLRLGQVMEKMPPKDAIAFIKKNLSERERLLVMPKVVEKWAKDDPKETLNKAG